MIDPDIVNIYSRPQQGGELPYFIGNQQGGNWLQTIGRWAMPILRKFGVPIAKAFGKAAWNTGKNIVNKEKNWRDAFKDNARDALPVVKRNTIDALKEGIEKFEQNGNGKRRKPPIRSINKKQKSFIF